VIVFSDTITPRLSYITGFVGKETGGTISVLTDNIDDFKRHVGPKINYSNKRITPEECWLRPHGLLFEKDIQQQHTDCFEVNGYKAFFQTEGDFSFDIFAATFYLLSRYEEYLPHQKDSYGRYAHKNSLAFKENFLHLPLINVWLLDLKERLKEKFPEFPFPHPHFQFLPTYDIDEAWSYKYKSWWRITGATLKNLVSGNLSKIAERRKVLKGNAQDPYDTFDWMDAFHEAYRLKPRYFFLVPEKTGKYDKNILPEEKPFQQLIRRHSEKYMVGVHPSWQTGDDPSLFKKEISTLEQITGTTIISSRQHFIRLHLPATCRHLIKAGIKEDFSMGYGSINGFRASVAAPFYWYDLEKEEATDLLLYPFCFMEANSFFEQKLTPQQALEEMRQYLHEVKAIEGTLITIWHNTFLGTDKKFSGWREVYEQFIKEVTEQMNR